MKPTILLMDMLILTLCFYFFDLKVIINNNPYFKIFYYNKKIPHTANITLEWLDQRFPARLISRCHVPECLPDLNLSDYYL